MYALWYVVFGVALIAIIALVCTIFLNKATAMNEKISEYKKAERCDAASVVTGVTFIICCIALVILILFSILVPIETKGEVKKYEYQKEYIETSIEAVKGDSDYLTITGDIFEYNDWLSKAKASVDIYGRFSRYYGLVENLEPIRLPTNKAD